MVAAGLVLTVGTGFFVASEFSLVNLDRADLEARAARGERGLRWIIGALKITSTHLSSAQLGITLTTLLTGYLLEPAFSHWLEPALSPLGWPEPVITTVATIIAVFAATLLSMIVGELVPKNFALSLPRQTAKVVVPFQVVFTKVFRPFVALLNGTANAILRAIGIEPREELSSARAPDELVSLVRRSAEQGSLDRDTATLLARTLAFSDHTAQDVMTPRPRLVHVDRDDPAQAVIELARRTGHSRFPVVDESIDEVVGLVHVKQAVAVPRDKRAEVPVGALQSDALRVPETMKLDVLLGELRNRGYQMAVVVDEYGGTAGVATLEDLVEELVGDILSENDRPAPALRQEADGSVVVDGAYPLHELERELEVEIENDEAFSTVAGLALSLADRIPAVGERFEVDGLELEILEATQRRVKRVRVRRTDHDEG